MSEKIGIREASRRLGVSDTAVRKAITAGRITIASRNDKGHPELAWPDIQQQWNQNSDAAKRTHVGSQGGVKRAKDDLQDPEFQVKNIYSPEKPKKPSKKDIDDDDNAGDSVSGVQIHDHMTLNEAKAAKAIYDARKAKMDYEEATGVLVRIEDVRSKIFKMTRSARDELLTIEDRLSPILASQTDITDVRATLREEIRRVCERIAAESEKI